MAKPKCDTPRVGVGCGSVTKTEISSAVNNKTTLSWEGFCVRRRPAGQAVKFWDVGQAG
jgi:hypothetical protein